MQSWRKIWVKLSDIGVRPNEPYSAQKKVRIVNRLTIIAFAASLFYFFFELFFLPPRETAELRSWFFTTHVILTALSLAVILFNYYEKRVLASILFILLFGTIFLPNTLLLAKPLRMEMYMYALASSVFIFFDKPRIILSIFLIPVAIYFVLILNLQHHYPEVFVLDVSAVIRIGLAFLFTYQVMNQFKRENILHQADIELKNKELTAQHNQLAQVNATKDKIFSIISHDLRGPIASLRSLLEMQQNSYLSPDEFQQMSKMLHTNVDHLYSTLDNLLQWSRTQTSEIKANPERLPLKPLVVSVVQLVKTTAASKSIHLLPDVPDSLYVFADENMVRSVLINLISNAIKFTPPGGAVSVKALPVDRQIEIEVKDNGRGMSPEVASSLFKDTQHYSTPGTENEPGTGLGLLLCKEFVEKNGGAISVTSIPGTGTTFTFSLPA